MGSREGLVGVKGADPKVKPREVDGPTQGHTGGKLQNSSPGWAPRSQTPARRSAERALRLSPHPPPAAMTALTFTTEDRLASSHIRSQATQPPGSLLLLRACDPSPVKRASRPSAAPGSGSPWHAGKSPVPGEPDRQQAGRCGGGAAHSRPQKPSAPSSTCQPAQPLRPHRTRSSTVLQSVHSATA